MQLNSSSLNVLTLIQKEMERGRGQNIYELYISFLKIHRTSNHKNHHLNVNDYVKAWNKNTFCN